jgi:ABC-type transport system involved in multi-copper enzyme maturation permease subunit
MLSRIWHNPVLRKELRTLRRQRSSKLIVILCIVIDLLVLTLVTVITGGIPEFALARRDRYLITLSTLSALQALLASIFTPGVMAQAIAGVRERQTWDLLRVTTLSTHEVLLGKYFALLAWMLIPAGAIVPVQIVFAVMARVPWWLWIVWALGVGSLTFTPSSIGLLCSVIFRSTLAARTVAYGTVLTLAASSAAAYIYFVSRQYQLRLAPLYLLLTPFLGLWILLGIWAWAGAIWFADREPG